jgi:hypothetical protein
MTVVAAGFPGGVTDDDWSDLVDLISNQGAIGLNVTAADGDRMVEVATGRANVAGVLARVTAPELVELAVAGSTTNDRIDLIVLRANWDARTCVLARVTGTPSANPQVPGLAQTPGTLYELPIAQVRLSPGQGTILQGDITKTVVPPVSGLYTVTRMQDAPNPDIGAAVWLVPETSLRLPVGGNYVEVAHGRGESFKSGVASVTTNSLGIGQIVHNLGWLPSSFVITPELNSDPVLITNYSQGPHTTSSQRVRAWNVITGGVLVNQTISDVHWHAARNV